jgi:hypothetical protein
MGERAAGEWDPANRTPGLERSHLGDDPSRAQVGHPPVEAANLEIAAEDGPNPLGLLLNHDDLAVPGRSSGTMPPTHNPLRLEAAILSRMRSEVTSRSNWANDKSTFSVNRPIEVVVLNCWVTETNDTP